jgi:hypothetical protein
MSAQAAPANTALVCWQQSLLTALWAPTHAAALDQLAKPGAAHRRFTWRGIAAYRSHAAAQAVRSLGAAYPVVESLVGQENFEALARLLWREQPPQGGDLAQWGAALAAQIEGLPELVADLPFLADVARVEWALHSMAVLGDAQAEPASLTLLAHEDPANLRLDLAPGTACFSSAWPVVTLIEAPRAAPPRRAPSAETARVWRCGWRPSLCKAQPGEPAFLRAVQEGKSLGAALGCAAGFDFSAWLAPAVQEGLLLRVVLNRAGQA